MSDTSAVSAATIALSGSCFLRACELDVAVRKPGNVSYASAGHGMQAEMFIASAQAAARWLFDPGLRKERPSATPSTKRLGARVEAAVNATFDVAGCNTNLGILLLCAPIAMAVERVAAAVEHPRSALAAADIDIDIDVTALRSALKGVLHDLNIVDSQAAFRAIARAHPGGLGNAPSEDVRAAPSVDFRAAMALAAHRDSIARQYRDDFADLFDIGLSAIDSGFSLIDHSLHDAGGGDPGAVDAHTTAVVQRLYLTLLARWPDSHIVRIHGEGVAHSVMTAAQGWLARADHGELLAEDPRFAEWDDELKAQRINPGTTADLTVATLFIFGLTSTPVSQATA